MKIKLKESVLRKIKYEMSSDEFFEYAMGVISDLRKLYSVSELSGEELKRIFGKCYSLVCYDSLLEDHICYKTFETNKYHMGELKTSIIVKIAEDEELYSFIDISAYYSNEDKLDINYIYSYEEIAELIKTKTIIIDEYYFSDERLVSESDIDKDKEYSDEAPFPALDYLYEDITGFEDVTLPLIRKRLQHSKVERDIMRIINIMRKRIRDYQKELSKQKSVLSVKKEEIERLISSNNQQQADFARKLSLLSEKRLENI